MDLDWNDKTGLTIQIQNQILTLDCKSQSNPPNWIAIRIEQSNPAIPFISLSLSISTFFSLSLTLFLPLFYLFSVSHSSCFRLFIFTFLLFLFLPLSLSQSMFLCLFCLYNMFFWSSFFWQLWLVGSAGCTVFGCLWQTSLCGNFGQQFFSGPRYIVNPQLPAVRRT